MACVSTCLILSPRLTQVGLSSKKPFLIRLRSPVDRYSFPGILTERCVSTRRKFNRHGIALVKAASLDKVSGAIKPGGLVESDKLPTDVRKRAMDAVDECGRRVTVGDVASRAGLKVTEAQTALQALAADTDGFLEVSDEGDVLYVFPRDYRTKLAAKSLRIQIEPYLEKAKGAIDYLARVSFGTALIASIVIVYTSIIALLSSRSDDDNRQRRRGRGYDSGFNFYINPVDLLWYWDPNYYNRRRAREDEGKGMNFIESVFSFVFGDGDPNQGIEEERWQMIGQYITSRGGVVAADELAPYLDVPSSKSAMNDESYILPVLLRFDGQPELDDEGNILYRFPSLQRTASGSSRRKEYVGKWFDWVADMEKFFKEKKWQFSKTSTSERALVIGLGAVNLFGVIVLNTLLNEMAVRPGGFLTFVKNIYPLLQIYAGSFFAIPLVRWFSIKRKNNQIENRNKARLQFARALESPDIALRRKLLSARDMAQNTVIGRDRIVYSTDRDMMEQNYETDEWDRRFKELEKSD
ncbi:unnamed protein product [Arabidopsis lyrata]|uniref:Iron-sulfur cluster biosynthesis family protein n=1 Tax=Arabidopsis lyrata subsp. lyrata TaxID=81972 RepID=D7LWV0_ARALL|nr:uncharacterized protein At5g03900, chloroplastic [Arabidopsis lyrata subsp. lyrata]EFH47321.1 hypothetical protein ARALYDRAFT_487168 [Arabidopsis lyrata subsp. lyrata]CAH8269962.1 unnamed protein product [Arabidopsis lyrata]|eukprot:XP_020876684.1 uncharacterized protein At5g03900, chloroplastic [Arabidopsis lyrata subsp. lyrata]